MRNKLLAIATALAVFTATGPALAAEAYLVTYYWDAAHTSVAGYIAIDCTGHEYLYGTETSYSTTQLTAC